MQILVLGAGAGGGLPQWNCNCPNCRGARQGKPAVTPRTQSSMAISSDGERWLLCNASPDIRAQLAATAPLSPEAFRAALLAKGDYYHIHHPYQVDMAEGRATPEQIRGWVANRFYYQVMIPQKDAALLANCPDAATRRRWIQRLLDHDGHGDDAGGIEAWLALGEAVGLPREALWSQEHVLPGVRFAVDAYVNFVRRASWQEGAISSLIELFAPLAHQSRLDTWPGHYPWIDTAGYAYFRKRLKEARRDVEHGLEVALAVCTTVETQRRALEILQFKLDVLWSMLDAMTLAYQLDRPPYHSVTDRRVYHRGLS